MKELLLGGNTLNLFRHEDYLSVLYSVLQLVLPLLDRLNNAGFELLVKVLQLLIVNVLTLDLNFEAKSIGVAAEESADSAGDSNGMQVDTDSDERATLHQDIFALLDSKVFANRMEATVLALYNNLSLSEGGSGSVTGGLCFTASYIFYFMLKTTRIKIHESNLLRKVAFNKFYLGRLWKTICTLKTADSMSKNEIYYLQILASGNIFFYQILEEFKLGKYFLVNNLL